MSQPPYKLTDVVDFIVVGSGAAGGAVAKELSTAGFTVVVLEQGPYLRARDFDHDEVGARYLHALTNDPKRQPTTFRKTAADRAELWPVVGYGRQVGGGTVHFTGNYWRFHEVDFMERSRWGALPGAALLIERTIVPQLEAAQERLNTLDHVPREHQPLVNDAEQYLHLREESWRLRAEGLRKNNLPAVLSVDQVAVDDSIRRQVEASHRKDLIFRGKIESMERASLEALDRIKRSDLK